VFVVWDCESGLGICRRKILVSSLVGFGPGLWSILIEGVPLVGEGLEPLVGGCCDCAWVGV